MPDEGMSPAQRLALVDRADPALSVAAQCRLLKVARSTLYYQAAPVDPDDLALMRRLDGEPQAGAAADASDGAGGDLPEAEHQPGASGAQGLPVSVAGYGHRAAGP